MREKVVQIKNNDNKSLWRRTVLVPKLPCREDSQSEASPRGQYPVYNLPSTMHLISPSADQGKFSSSYRRQVWWATSTTFTSQSHCEGHEGHEGGTVLPSWQQLRLVSHARTHPDNPTNRRWCPPFCDCELSAPTTHIFICCCYSGERMLTGTVAGVNVPANFFKINQHLSGNSHETEKRKKSPWSCEPGRIIRCVLQECLHVTYGGVVPRCEEEPSKKKPYFFLRVTKSCKRAPQHLRPDLGVRGSDRWHHP